FRRGRKSTSSWVGAWRRRSIASTTTRLRAPSSAGDRVTTLCPCSPACATAAISAAHWRARSVSRGMGSTPCQQYERVSFRYGLGMERVRTTIDERTLTRIKRVAGPRGVSKFLATAAKERLARLELLGLLDELDAKHGKPNAALRAEI